MGTTSKTPTKNNQAVTQAPPHTVMTLRQQTRRKKPLPKITLADAEVIQDQAADGAQGVKGAKGVNDVKSTKDVRDAKTVNDAKTAANPQLTTAPQPTANSQSTAAATAPQSAATDSRSTTPPNAASSHSTHQQTNEEKNMKLSKIRFIHPKPRYIVLAVVVCLIAIFFARVAIWEHNYLLAMEGSERDVVVSEVYDGGDSVEIDVTEPTEVEIAEYHVAADRPRYLTIRSLGLYNVRIIEIGLLESGELDVPRNIYNAGWYVGSSLPGTDGVSLIDAHGGDLGYGIFRNLPKISLGDEIDIEMGDEVTHYIYKVHDIAAIPLGEEANAYMTSTAIHSPESGVPSLTLITCTGDWLLSSQTYSKRLFVRATLVR